MEIINIARSIGGEGLEDLAINEIDELFEEQELNEEEVIDMITRVPLEIRSDTESSGPISKITAKTIKDGLQMAGNIEMHFLNNDPDIFPEIKQCVARYEEIYKNIKKDEQSRITDFFELRRNITENVIESNCDDDIQLIKRRKIPILISSSDSDIE